MFVVSVVIVLPLSLQLGLKLSLGLCLRLLVRQRRVEVDGGRLLLVLLRLGRILTLIATTHCPRAGGGCTGCSKASTGKGQAAHARDSATNPAAKSTASQAAAEGAASRHRHRRNTSCSRR